MDANTDQSPGCLVALIMLLLLFMCIFILGI